MELYINLMGIMSNGDCFHDIHRLIKIQKKRLFHTSNTKRCEKAFKQSLEINENDNLTLTIAFMKMILNCMHQEQKL